MNPIASTKDREETPEQIKAKDKWDKYYRETLPKEIMEATEAFDDSVIMYMDSPLMEEIEANLNDCQTDAQRERYLFSLLKPFGESPSGCGIARVYEPTAELNQLKEAIKDCERDKAFWQTLPEDEQLKNVNGEPSGTPKEQIDACNSMCKRYQEQIDWVLYVNHQFIDLTCTDKDKEGSVERCLSAFVGVKVMFANRLDALLLTYGIDLLRLQRESGLYLKDHRLITDVDSYIGSMELAQRYIDALPKEPQQKQTTKGKVSSTPQIPSVLNNDRANKYFAKAMEAGLMNEKFKWQETKFLLACFCRELSIKLDLGKGCNSNGEKRLCWKPFEQLFNVPKGSLRACLNDIQKTGNNPIGIEKVDAIFEK